jgi:hypothetical protein
VLAAVRHLEYVQQGLARHTFQAVKLGLAADALQWCQPCIGRTNSLLLTFPRATSVLLFNGVELTNVALSISM